MNHAANRRPLRNGITMVESLIAVSITAIAGGALLTSLGAAIQSSSNAADLAVARGLAQQLMDEALATRFPTETDTRPLDGTRMNFDDLDDYNNWSARPPVERSGVPLGQDGRLVAGIRLPRTDVLCIDAGSIANFTREVQVDHVEPNGAGGWDTTNADSNSRRITVRVRYTDARSNTRTLIELVQIVSNVPVAP